MKHFMFVVLKKQITETDYKSKQKILDGREFVYRLHSKGGEKVKSLLGNQTYSKQNKKLNFSKFRSLVVREISG